MFAGTCTCSQKSDGPFLGPVGFHLHPCTEPVKNVVSWYVINVCTCVQSTKFFPYCEMDFWWKLWTVLQTMLWTWNNYSWKLFVWWHHCIEIVSVLFFIYVNKWSNSCRFSRCNNFKVWMLMLFIKKMGKSMPDYGKFVNKILF